MIELSAPLLPFFFEKSIFFHVENDAQGSEFAPLPGEALFKAKQAIFAGAEPSAKMKESKTCLFPPAPDEIEHQFGRSLGQKFSGGAAQVVFNDSIGADEQGGSGQFALRGPDRAEMHIVRQGPSKLSEVIAREKIEGIGRQALHGLVVKIDEFAKIVPVVHPHFESRLPQLLDIPAVILPNAPGNVLRGRFKVHVDRLPVALQREERIGRQDRLRQQWMQPDKSADPGVLPTPCRKPGKKTGPKGRVAGQQRGWVTVRGGQIMPIRRRVQCLRNFPAQQREQEGAAFRFGPEGQRFAPFGFPGETEVLGKLVEIMRNPLQNGPPATICRIYKFRLHFRHVSRALWNGRV
ncbi:MAG: hypothetical protein WDA20_13055, partial [Desulfuromonadales bacterium]